MSIRIEIPKPSFLAEILYTSIAVGSPASAAAAMFFALTKSNSAGDAQNAHALPCWKSSAAFALPSWAIPEPLQKPSNDPAFA